MLLCICNSRSNPMVFPIPSRNFEKYQSKFLSVLATLFVNYFVPNYIHCEKVRVCHLQFIIEPKSKFYLWLPSGISSEKNNFVLAFCHQKLAKTMKCRSWLASCNKGRNGGPAVRWKEWKKVKEAVMIQWEKNEAGRILSGYSKQRIT